MLDGHFIFSKRDAQPHILGTTYFSGGKIARLTRPLDDEINTWNDDVVAFARAVNRALSSTARDGASNVRVSVQHERLANAESDVLLLSFPDGHAIQIETGTMDKPNPSVSNKRDFATLEEILGAQ